MIQFSPVKINLGLQVLQKRPDGYHDIHSVFFPLPVHDILEIILDESGTGVSLTISGKPVPGFIPENTCVRAWDILKADFPDLPAAKIHLYKTVPAGAGLGAGSANGAIALRMLNTLAGLNLSLHQLHQYAAKLGSDCPFFLYDSPCEIHGRGEIVEPLDFDLNTYAVWLINPGIHISTREAFAGIQLSEKEAGLLSILSEPASAWKDRLVNDFERSVFPGHPEIAAIKESLYNAGAAYASMSGSGSTVFGIFDKAPTRSIDFPAHYFTRIIPPVQF